MKDSILIGEYPAIAPCAKCGKNVKIEYVCSLSPDLVKLVKNPFAGSTPCYYVQCECGSKDHVRVDSAVHYDREKAVKKLAHRWNKNNK